MNSISPENNRYALSFTSGTILTREAVIAVPLYLETRDWSIVRERLRLENLLQTRTRSSGFRLAREITQRLAALADDELELLRDASPSERDHLMWVAACRHYHFIGEFAEEVVRERFLLLTPKLNYGEFDSFVHRKSLWHPELTEVKDSTLRKLRSTLFRMMTEAELLANGEIVTVALSGRVREVLDAQMPSDVRYFPTRESRG